MTLGVHKLFRYTIKYVVFKQRYDSNDELKAAVNTAFGTTTTATL